MTRFDTVYLIITGAATARRIPTLIEDLAGTVPNLITVLTPNAQNVVSLRELSMVAGHHVVESYFDDVILPRPSDGVILIAPCTFNSLNKLAQGIADNLALSITAEAIGRGTPVIVAVSVNPPLWAHPRAKESVAVLRSWSVTVIDPAADGDYLSMAENAVLVEAVRMALEAE